MHYRFVIWIIVGLALSCASCVHRQYVTEPYPRWGTEIEVDQPGSSEHLIVRVAYPPDMRDARACLLLVHGMNEYIGRYAGVADYFAKNFLVAGFDLYAHGLSHPSLHQADLALGEGANTQEIKDAYLAQLPLKNLDLFRKNFDQALQQLVSICNGRGLEGKPVFIVSHSLGSLIVASYLLQHPREQSYIKRIAGVVFLGPAFAVTEVPGWRGWFTNPFIKLSFHAEEQYFTLHDKLSLRAMANQALALIVVPLLDGVFEVLSWPGLRSLFSPITPDWVVDYLTDDEQEKAQIRSDGWMIRQTVLRYVKGIEAEIVAFRYQMSAFDWPYYLIYSERDPITASWGNHDFAQATLHNHPDNQILAYPELKHHEHLFSAQPLRNEILEKIVQWVDRRMIHLRSSNDD